MIASKFVKCWIETYSPMSTICFQVAIYFQQANPGMIYIKNSSSIGSYLGWRRESRFAAFGKRKESWEIEILIFKSNKKYKQDYQFKNTVSYLMYSSSHIHLHINVCESSSYENHGTEFAIVQRKLDVRNPTPRRVKCNFNYQ